MPQNMVFYQGLHCLPRQNQSLENKIEFFLEIITCDPSIYIMDRPELTVSNVMEQSIGLKKVKHQGFPCWFLTTVFDPNLL